MSLLASLRCFVHLTLPKHLPCLCWRTTPTCPEVSWSWTPEVGLSLPYPTSCVTLFFRFCIPESCLNSHKVLKPLPVHWLKTGTRSAPGQSVFLSWAPDASLGLIRKSPPRVQRPISAVKIPHSALSLLSSAKRPVSGDERDESQHTRAGGFDAALFTAHCHEYRKTPNESFNLPTAFRQKRKGFPF